MSLVTLSDLACCQSFGLGQGPGAITAVTINESGVEKLRRMLCEPMAILAMTGVAAGIGLWFLTRGSVKSNPRRNVIYGGMGNVRCIRCKQLKDYDQMAQAPGAAVRDDRDGQYYGLCQDCHRDEEILRKVFAASPRTAARRSAKKGAKAAKKSSKAKARKRNDDKKPPSIAELMKQSYDRHAAVRGGSSR